MPLPKQLFIIDDDIDDIDILKEALIGIDDSILCYYAMNGADGLQLLQESKVPFPDVIFLDLNMPKVNGKEFLEKIKMNETLRDIPVIIYSTLNVETEMAKLIAMGAKAFIVKPESFQQLIQKLQEVLETV